VKKCSFCKEELVQELAISIERLHVCKGCNATFIPKNQLLKLIRKVSPYSRQMWNKALQKSQNIEVSGLQDLITGEKLVYAKIPEYSHKCWQAPVPDLLHLQPLEFAKILEINADISEEFSSSYKVKNKKNPLAFLGRLFISKTEHLENINLDQIQFERKIKPYLKDEI
jgi:hypothetical protein